MPKVLCTLPNASDDIGGIKFVTHAKGMLSEEISNDDAKRLASIPGYELVDAPAPTPAPTPAPAPTAAPAPAPAPVADDAADAERDALELRAKAVGLRVKGNWSLPRLKTEVEDAELAATAPAQAGEKTDAVE